MEVSLLLLDASRNYGARRSLLCGLGLVAGLLVLWALSRGGGRRRLWRTLRVAFVLVAGFASMLWAGNGFRLDRAQEFCEELVTRLEEYKEANGEYPATVNDVLTMEDEIPRYLRECTFAWYSRGQEGFMLSFENPWALMFSIHYYDAESGTWHLTT